MGKDKRNSVRNRCENPWNPPGRKRKKNGVKSPVRRKLRVKKEKEVKVSEEKKVKRKKKKVSVKSKHQQEVKNENETEDEGMRQFMKLKKGIEELRYWIARKKIDIEFDQCGIEGIEEAAEALKSLITKLRQ